LAGVRGNLVGLAIAAAALAACAAEKKPGLEVTVDLAEFTGLETLKVAVSASNGGFQAMSATNVDNIGLTTEDLNGDGQLELVTQFVRPHSPVTFRVTTDNANALQMTASAMAFNSDDLIASASSAPVAVTAGGESAVALRLAHDASPIGAKTRTTDLETASTDVSILGRRANVNMTSLAVCDLDGDLKQDIIIGAPGDDTLNLGATGAVYVVWGGWNSGTTIDLAEANANATIIYGTGSGEHLGASVACADLDGDQIDDLVVGAPGADLGHGRLYVLFGRLMFANSRPVDLASSSSSGADIVWKTATAGANLGEALFAVGKSRGISPFLLAAAPGAQVTHLLSDFTRSAAARSADAADHPTFTGAPVTAMAAGEIDEAPDSGMPFDIALADPSYRDASDQGSTRGKVYLFSNVSPTGTAAIDVATAHPTITGAGLTSQLGTALLIADTSGGGQDLIVGAPGEDGKGAVYVFAHDDALFLPDNLTATGTIAGYEPGGLFGSALASTRAGTASAVGLRLAVGAPNVTRADRAAAGAAYLYKADPGRTFRIFEQVYGQAGGDALGTTVAGGQLNSATDQIGDLVTAAPNAAGSAPGTGVAYVRYGQ
jgi:hypothetical protein